MSQLEKELREINKETEKLEAKSLATESEGELAYSGKQREEYNRLKDAMGAQTATLREELNAKKRSIRGDEPALLQLRSKVRDESATSDHLVCSACQISHP